jgi:hypothetical protein
MHQQGRSVVGGIVSSVTIVQARAPELAGGGQQRLAPTDLWASVGNWLVK